MGFQPPCQRMKSFASKGSVKLLHIKCAETDSFCLIADTGMLTAILVNGSSLRNKPVYCTFHHNKM